MINRLLKQKETLLILIVIILSTIIALINPTFLKIENFVDLMKGNSVLGIMALGMLIVLISGGIDLSITGIITLTSVITGILLRNTTFSLGLIILICVLVGGFVGLINGLIITRFEIPPIVVTLGTNSILMGLILYETEGNMITGLPQWFKNFGVLSIFKIGNLKLPIQTFLYLIVFLLVFLLINYTVIGRGFYAIGGNEISAMRVGYNVKLIRTLVYVFNGMLVGFAGIINTSIVQGVNPNTYIGTDMLVISIAVIGGASILGGVGTVTGTLLGTILMAIINNGLILAKVPTFWQKIAMGVIILIAISIDILNYKKQKLKLIKVDIED
ncbi:ABC transporter permease [Oceanivirga salmonicida]|uniref:ABC transporter permease n=1 Tax=Oceanivirga salmonicida TaxID=1769291 RepID=UPI000831293C|nr:ABC transporter permease [Oceanivirga salmonicida]